MKEEFIYVHHICNYFWVYLIHSWLTPQTQMTLREDKVETKWRREQPKALFAEEQRKMGSDYQEAHKEVASSLAIWSALLLGPCRTV